MALEAFRERKLTGYPLHKLLGTTSRFDFPELLKERQIETVEDMEHDLAALKTVLPRLAMSTVSLPFRGLGIPRTLAAERTQAMTTRTLDYRDAKANLQGLLRNLKPSRHPPYL